MTTPALSTPNVTAELIRYLGHIGGTNDTTPLTAAQWTALRFVARANRLTRTPSAFAAFHGSTRGTASQTMKSLVRAGYLRRERDPRDGRRVLFEITQAGANALTADPADSLDQAIAMLPPQQRAELTATVQALAAAVSNASPSASFGYCGRCRHRCGSGSDSRCAVTDEPITTTDCERLCCAFEPDAASSVE